MSEKVKKKRLRKVICWVFAYIPAMEGHALKSDPNRSFIYPNPFAPQTSQRHTNAPAFFRACLHITNLDW